MTRPQRRMRREATEGGFECALERWQESAASIDYFVCRWRALRRGPCGGHDRPVPDDESKLIRFEARVQCGNRRGRRKKGYVCPEEARRAGDGLPEEEGRRRRRRDYYEGVLRRQYVNGLFLKACRKQENVPCSPALCWMPSGEKGQGGR